MKNTYLWILVAVAVAVGAIIYFRWESPSILLENGPPTDQASPSSSPDQAPAGQAKPQFKEADIKTYSEYVNQYEGRRIQFDEGCQATPNEATFKSGTSIMLDNRSAQTKNVTVGSTTYSLPGYGYRIITLSSPVLPMTLNLSCGSSPSVGKILLQAIILQQ